MNELYQRPDLKSVSIYLTDAWISLSLTVSSFHETNAMAGIKVRRLVLWMLLSDLVDEKPVNLRNLLSETSQISVVD